VRLALGYACQLLYLLPTLLAQLSQALLRGGAQPGMLQWLQSLLWERQLGHPPRLPEDLYYQQLLKWSLKKPKIAAWALFLPECLLSHLTGFVPAFPA